MRIIDPFALSITPLCICRKLSTLSVFTNNMPHSFNLSSWVLGALFLHMLELFYFFNCFISFLELSHVFLFLKCSMEIIKWGWTVVVKQGNIADHLLLMWRMEFLSCTFPLISTAFSSYFLINVKKVLFSFYLWCLLCLVWYTSQTPYLLNVSLFSFPPLLVDERSAVWSSSTFWMIYMLKVISIQKTLVVHVHAYVCIYTHAFH